MKRNVILALVCVAAVSTPTLGGAGIPELDTVRVVSGLSGPLYATWAPGDPNRMFVLEQHVGNQGRVRIVDLSTNPATLLPIPYLSITTATGNEQGLLGMAFHPDFQTNRKFYISHASPNSFIVEYEQSVGNPNAADLATARTILTIPQPFSNHNGGWIDFGPDGYLYAAFGDGGSAGDPGNRAQNLSQLLGKMLRIDVNGDDFPADAVRNYSIPPTNPFNGGVNTLDDPIWSYGLRNHWRNSFDRDTDEMWIGDVGQNSIEEIDYEPANTGGRNYGWRCYEGNNVFNAAGCGPAANYVFPVHTYTHSFGCSVTGGYVYRGNAICALRGTYFFADYCSATIWSFFYTGAVTQFTNRTAELAPGGGLSIASITSFAEDLDGELYIVDQGGEVFKIVTGVAGAECPPVGLDGDMNCDGVVTVADIGGFVLAITDPAGYAATFPDCDINNADVNDDGSISVADIGPFVALLTGG